MKKLIVLSTLGMCTIFLVQCTKFTSKGGASTSPTLPSTAFDYKVTMPTNVINNTPSSNKITNAGATLGRVLFFDNKLSINNTTACGSCHNQSNAFADPVKLSKGFEGNLTSRNSMSIINAANENSYFWDGRTAGLEEMVLQPVRHQVEMGMEKMTVLPNKLAKVDYYGPLFTAAFGSPEVTQERISMAMAQFIRSMTSYSSLADESGVANSWGSDVNNKLNATQKAGAQLFFGKANCSSCHSGTNFRGNNDADFANIGLELTYIDKGIGELDPSKEGIFRVPSLRNVALTGPYMHDGRFATLQDVIQHYNKGVVKHKNLDQRLTDSWSTGGEARKLNLTNAEVENLVAFLKTLTDNTVVTSPKFSNPFVN
jgi:cytochrome c peroxidase